MTSGPDTPPLAGLLVIDKPVGPTSMGVCRAVRSRLIRAGAPKRVKVGHGGTLDPYASGVLVVLIGKATRLVESVMAGDKRYLADIDLRHRSTTDDMEGELVAVDAPPVPREDVAQAITRFVGVIDQAPPAHSAVKIGGARAYELARAGKLHELDTRPVRVDAIEITHYRFPRLVLDIRCGKGVYIRSLARDIGVALGTGGMLGGLRRTQVSAFHDRDATPLMELPDRLTQDDLLITPEVRTIREKLAGGTNPDP